MSDISTKSPPPVDNARPSRRSEFLVFAIIAALIWPVVAVGVVGGYGFIVWMTQIVIGPPGPPAPH